MARRPGRSRPDFAQAAALSGDVDDLLGTAIAVEALAWTAAAAGQFERSAILLGAADALWSAAGNPGVVIPALRSNRDEAGRCARVPSAPAPSIPRSAAAAS